MTTPAWFWIAVAAVAAVALAIGVRDALRGTGEDWTRRLTRVIGPVAMLGVVLVVVGGVAEVPFRDWSAARLAFAATIVEGVPQYPGPDHGAVRPLLYGPVQALLMAPAFLAPGITGALLVGGAINMLVALVPLFLLNERPSYNSSTLLLLAANLAHIFCSFIFPHS